MYDKLTTTIVSALVILTLAWEFPIQAEGFIAGNKPEFNNIEIPFIINQGQADDGIVAYAQIFRGKVYVEKNGNIVYSFKSDYQRSFILEEHAVKAACDEITFEDKAPTKINYFKGSDKSNWRNNIPSFNVINLGELYDGITLKLKAHGNNIEKLFYIAPGANPKSIRISLEQIDRIMLTDEGELEAEGTNGSAFFTKPVAYQEISGLKKYVDVSYRILGHEYGFDLGDYDKDHILIIDPLLASTYLGGSGLEGWDYSGVIDNTVDSEGNLLVAGMTESLDFPYIEGHYECDTRGNADLFIAKFDEDLTELLAVTVIGGSADERYPRIKVGENGFIYLLGQSFSANYPTTEEAFSQSYVGNGDIVISRFDPELATLTASTYIGGAGLEDFPALDLDDSDHVFISGLTSHDSYPTVEGCYRTYIAGSSEYFISKLDSDLSTLIASTFIGGQYQERHQGMMIAPSGEVVLAGTTASPDYPTTAGAFDTTFNGLPPYDEYNNDAVVSKFDNGLTTLLASTFVGAEDYEGGSIMAIDTCGSIFFGGHTGSPDYPTTPGVFDEEHNGINEFFITKMNCDLTAMEASTFLTPDKSGEDGFIFINDMIIDERNRLIMVGAAWDTCLYTTANAYDRSFNGGMNDLGIMVMSDDLTMVEYASYLGGSGNEGDAAVANGNGRNFYVAAYSSSTDFPIIPETWQPAHAGGEKDCTVAKLTTDQFTRITEGQHVTNAFRSSGVCLIDYNNDNYLDIYETNARYPDMENNCLYENNGDGTFSQIFGLAIVNDNNFSTGAIWADYDNDNDLDLFVSAHRTHPNLFYINNGDGSFTLDTSVPVDDSVVGSTTASWIDYNNDGDIDLFIGNSTCGPCPEYPPYRNFLFKNTDGVFSEITSGDIVTIEKHTYGATWCDYDNDGDVDLIDPNKDDELTDLFRNEGNDIFTHITTDIITTMTGNSGYSTWADYDNDGDMDLFLGGITPGTNHLYNNNGDGTFSEAPDNGLGLFLGKSDNGSWVDYDNDGDQDILIYCNIYESGTVDSDSSLGYLFINNNGDFTKLTDTLIFSDSSLIQGTVWGDCDRDGDLDLYVPMFLLNQEGTQNFFYINNGNSNNWVTIKCVGTNSNKSAIGAKVRLKANIFGSPRWQMREITSQIEPSTQPPLESHFGLGDASIIDSIKIEWPSGIVDVYTDISPNQFITYTETVCGDADGNFNVNLLDITYLISYLYKGGPAPQHMQAADPDGNGTVNILDITYLISYLYKGGAEPQCL